MLPISDCVACFRGRVSSTGPTADHALHLHPAFVELLHLSVEKQRDASMIAVYFVVVSRGASPASRIKQAQLQ